jgi:hypothetical protein
LIPLFKKGFLNRRKVYLTEKRLSQDEEKVFSEKKLFYFLEYVHVKEKKRNAFLPTLYSGLLVN